MRELLGDAVFLGGLGAVGVALWWMWPPLAVLLCGMFLAVFGLVIGARAKTKAAK